jgi:hypothetical protein
MDKLLLLARAVLKLNVDFTHSVDLSGMGETPAGVRGRETPQARSAEEAPRNAREPHAHVAEINSQV